MEFLLGVGAGIVIVVALVVFVYKSTSGSKR